MKHFFLIALILFPFFSFSQNSVLLIARNKGEKTLSDGQTIRTMGFAKTLSENPGVPGPTLIFEEGDSAEIDLWNVSQGAPHTIHLHGLDVNQQNDGVPHLSFTVGHMEHGYYRFKVPFPGTYLYHCHVVSTLHVQGGMYGVLIVYPKGSRNHTWTGGPRYERDYSILTSEIDPVWHSDSVMVFSHDSAHQRVKIPPYRPTHFLINGYSDQQIDEELGVFDVIKDSNTFFRFSNIGFNGNTIYFPKSMEVEIVSSDGRPLTTFSQDSLTVYPGERYGVLIKSKNIGTDSIQIYYTNLNNGKRLNRQRIVLESRETSNIQQLEKTKLMVFPNPTRSELSIQHNYTGPAVIRVYSLQGRVVISKEMEFNNIYTLDLASKLSSGIYFIELETPEGVLRTKVQKY